MEQIKKTTLRESFTLTGRNTKAFYVLPRIDLNKEDPSGEIIEGYPFLLSFIHKGEVYLIEKDPYLVGNKDYLRAGMELILTWDDSKDSLKQEKYYKSPQGFKVWRKICNIKKVKLYYGQGILISAQPERGKSYQTRLLMDSFKKANPNIWDVRILFGERNVDSLGPNTVNCDSSGTIEYQLWVLYKYLTLALYNCYQGKDVIVAIDSLTRMVESLSNKYSDTHMVSGGISTTVVKMLNDLFRMSGSLGEGSLTIVGTALWAKSTNTWKNVYIMLSSIATAEFNPNVRSGDLDSSRIKNEFSKKGVTLLGIDFMLTK